MRLTGVHPRRTRRTVIFRLQHGKQSTISRGAGPDSQALESSRGVHFLTSSIEVTGRSMLEGTTLLVFNVVYPATVS